jgi:hypothetical protein
MGRGAGRETLRDAIHGTPGQHGDRVEAGLCARRTWRKSILTVRCDLASLGKLVYGKPSWCGGGCGGEKRERETSLCRIQPSPTEQAVLARRNPGMLQGWGLAELPLMRPSDWQKFTDTGSNAWKHEQFVRLYLLSRATKGQTNMNPLHARGWLKDVFFFIRPSPLVGKHYLPSPTHSGRDDQSREWNVSVDYRWICRGLQQPMPPTLSRDAYSNRQPVKQQGN